MTPVMRCQNTQMVKKLSRNNYRQLLKKVKLYKRNLRDKIDKSKLA